jgi:hypothetical protein
MASAAIPVRVMDTENFRTYNERVSALIRALHKQPTPLDPAVVDALNDIAALVGIEAMYR